MRTIRHYAAGLVLLILSALIALTGTVAVPLAAGALIATVLIEARQLFFEERRWWR